MLESAGQGPVPDKPWTPSEIGCIIRVNCPAPTWEVYEAGARERHGEVVMVLAVLDDLFFTVKINESAKRAGVTVEVVKSGQDVFEKARARPALIILDLNYQGIDPLKLIQDLKADTDTQGVPLLGYLSHVQGELKQKAQQAGCDTVLPRSVFSQKLTQILQSHASAPL